MNEIMRVQPEDDDVDELWSRATDEPDICGVEAERIDEIGGWLVGVPVQEFFRQDPLGVELRRHMVAALRAVDGVATVSDHDNESWFVTGTPSGEALTRAAAIVLDDLADRLREGMQHP